MQEHSAIASDGVAVPLAFFPADEPHAREPLQLMRDWRHWAVRCRLDFGDEGTLQDAVARYRGPVLSVSLEADEYSCPAAVDRALAPFTAARVARVTLGPEAQGEFLGHFRWARRPSGVARVLGDWIDGTVARR